MDHIDDDDAFASGPRPVHLFRHPHLGVDDIYDAWAAKPLSCPAISSAHWLMRRVDGPLRVQGLCALELSK